MAATLINMTRGRDRRLNPRKNDPANRPQPTTPINIVSAVKAASTVTITFNQPVTLKGVPQWTVVGALGANPLSASLTSATVLVITYTAPVAAATAINIPYEDLSVRNTSGGFVANSTFPLA